MRPFPREPGRVPFVVTSALVAAAALGAGCAQLIGIEDLPEVHDGGNDNPDADARPVSDAGPDANPPCADSELRLVLHIGGTPVTDAQPSPYVEALLGDVVEISAAGSCAGGGVPSYEWAITPDNGILATAEPTLADGPETFTVYPSAAGEYTVALTVRGSGGMSVGRDAIAIRAHDWQVAEQPVALDIGEVRDLSVGGGNLWIAGENGPFFLPLAGPTDAFARVEVNGAAVPTDLEAVLFDERTDYLWFGSAAATDGPWRLTTTRTPPDSVQIPFNVAEALGGTAQTRDIAANGTDTITVATSRGATAVDGSESMFAAKLGPNVSLEALAVGAGRRMAGSRQVYDLDTNGVFDIEVGGTDNRIRTMAIDDDREVLWIGTAGEGVVAFDLRSNTRIALFTENDSGLGSNTVHALFVESQGPYAGDMWAATDRGVSRFILRRQTWIHMAEDHGLSGHLDLRALAIDTSANRRVIYGGSAAGVVYMRVP